MKKIVLAAAVAALVAAPTAVAGPNANANTRATTKTCNNMKAQMGATNFKALFAPKAQNARAVTRSCATREASVQRQERMNAAQTCKTWMSDANAFSAAMMGTANEGKTFAQVYGTSANAYGKCVSTLARQKGQERRAAMVNAAKTCKTWKTDAAAFGEAMKGTTNEGKTFGEVFGTESNAYGKCVSTVSKSRPSA